MAFLNPDDQQAMYRADLARQLARYGTLYVPRIGPDGVRNDGTTTVVLVRIQSSRTDTAFQRVGVNGSANNAAANWAGPGKILVQADGGTKELYCTYVGPPLVDKQTYTFDAVAQFSDVTSGGQTPDYYEETSHIVFTVGDPPPPPPRRRTSTSTILF